MPQQTETQRQAAFQITKGEARHFFEQVLIATSMISYPLAFNYFVYLMNI